MLLIFVDYASKIYYKNVRAIWTEDNLRQAVVAVTMGSMSKHSEAKEFKIPRATLIRRIKNISNAGTEKKLGRPPVLSGEQEEELVQAILSFEAQLFGLTAQDIRKLVFDFCVRNNIAHCFGKGSAGYNWFHSFMARHHQLSARMPEATSIHHALGFNRKSGQLLCCFKTDII